MTSRPSTDKKSPKRAKPRVGKETVKDLDVPKDRGAEQVRGGGGYSYTVNGSI